MNVNEIKDYIIKKYPNSCLAYNSKNHDYYEEELIKECEDFFYYEKLKWCGCGNPEKAKKVIRDFLNILYTDSKDKENDWMTRCKNQEFMIENRFDVRSIYGNELLLCLAYTLDAAEFTEHGSSIGGAWITEEGKMFLWLLEQNEELDED